MTSLAKGISGIKGIKGLKGLKSRKVKNFGKGSSKRKSLSSPIRKSSSEGDSQMALSDKDKISDKDKERVDREKKEEEEKHRPPTGGAHPTNPLKDPTATPGRPDNKGEDQWDRAKENNDRAKDSKEGTPEERGAVTPLTMNLGGESFGQDPTAGTWMPGKESYEAAAQTSEPVEGQLPHRVGNESLKSELVKTTLDPGEVVMRLKAFIESIPPPPPEARKEFDSILNSLQVIRI